MFLGSNNLFIFVNWYLKLVSMSMSASETVCIMPLFWHLNLHRRHYNFSFINISAQKGIKTNAVYKWRFSSQIISVNNSLPHIIKRKANFFAIWPAISLSLPQQM